MRAGDNADDEDLTAERVFRPLPALEMGVVSVKSPREPYQEWFFSLLFCVNG
jgi:hypothetical protein